MDKSEAPDSKRNEATVSASEKRLRFLDGLSTATRSVTDPRLVLEVVARMLGQHLAVNRCAYAHVEADQDHFELLGDYNDGVPSIVGRYAFTDFGDEVRRLMQADLPYVNDDVDTHPVTAGTDLAAYRQTRIQAVICVPLHKDGRFVAAMAVHQARPRHWAAAEIALVREVVARCWESFQRSRGEQQLREANQRLQLALAAAQLGDWEWHAATDLITLSPRAWEVFGMPDGSALTRSQMREWLHPEDATRAKAAVEDSVRTGVTYSMEYRVLPPGGTLRWVSAQGKPTHGADGRVVGMIGVVQDITVRRVAEEALRGESQMLELLNRSGAALAAQLELQTLLQTATDAATQLTGARFGAFFYNGVDAQGEAYLLYTLSGAPRSAFERFGHPRPTALFGPTFRGEPAIRVDDILLDPRYGQWGPHHGMPPGHLPVRSYLAVPVTGRDGQVIGGLFFAHSNTGVFTERSERLAIGVAAQAAIAIDNARLYAESQRAAEERRSLLESERAARHEAERANATKDEFLATLSHELRTPLSAMLGWTHILRRKLPEELADLRRGIDVIERSTRVQTQLIEDLLDMSRITSGKLRVDVRPVTAVSFIEAAVETVRAAAENAQVRIRTQLDDGVGLVAGDAARLQQIVWNLLANAVKFTPAGGAVDVQLARSGEQAVIRVIDSGAGIRPDFLPHIFDRFRQADGSTTRRYGGLGLGLSIVKHLVELHGGSIEVHSAGEGQGATFVVHLPLVSEGGVEGPRASLLRPAASSAMEPVDLAGLQVVVVDDEPHSRELLQRLLEDAGAQVRLADGAVAALALVRALRPDVLVSDISMPDMDGYELLRRLRSLEDGAGAQLPVIALTAFARAEDRERALQSGFALHVSKPVEPAEILASVLAVARNQTPSSRA